MVGNFLKFFWSECFRGIYFSRWRGSGWRWSHGRGRDFRERERQKGKRKMRGKSGEESKQRRNGRERWDF